MGHLDVAEESTGCSRIKMSTKIYRKCLHTHNEGNTKKTHHFGCGHAFFSLYHITATFQEVLKRSSGSIYNNRYTRALSYKQWYSRDCPFGKASLSGSDLSMPAGWPHWDGCQWLTAWQLVVLARDSNASSSKCAFLDCWKAIWNNANG